jgi:hypothetical protein
VLSTFFSPHTQRRVLEFPRNPHADFTQISVYTQLRALPFTCNPHADLTQLRALPFTCNPHKVYTQLRVLQCTRNSHAACTQGDSVHTQLTQFTHTSGHFSAHTAQGTSCLEPLAVMGDFAKHWTCNLPPSGLEVFCIHLDWRFC